MFLIIFFLLNLSFIGCLNASNAHVPDSVRVDQLAFLDAHNIAMSTKSGWFYAQQGKSVGSLLEKYGVRSMKVPVHWYHKKSFTRGIKKIFGKKEGNTLPYPALCHEENAGTNCKSSVLQRGGKDPESLENFLREIVKFVKKYPKEVILVKLETYMGSRTPENYARNMTAEEAVQRFDQAITDSGLGVYVNKIDTWPTLGSLRNSNKTVILLGTENGIISHSKYLSPSRLLINQEHWAEAKKADCTLFTSTKESNMTQISIGHEMSFTKNSPIGLGLSALNASRKLLGYPPLRIANTAIDSYDFKKVNTREALEAELKKCRAKHVITGFVVSGDHVDKGELREVVDEHNLLLSVTP